MEWRTHVSHPNTDTRERDKCFPKHNDIDDHADDDANGFSSSHVTFYHLVSWSVSPNKPLPYKFSMGIYVYCLTAQTNTLKDKQKKKKTILYLVIFVCISWDSFCCCYYCCCCKHWRCLLLSVCSLVLSYGAHSFFYRGPFHSDAWQKQNTFFSTFPIFCQYRKLFAMHK